MMSAMSSRAIKRLERAEAQDVVADVVDEMLLLGRAQHEALDVDDLGDDVGQLFAHRLGRELGQLLEIDRVEQRVEDGDLDLVEALLSSGTGGLAGAA